MVEENVGYHTFSLAKLTTKLAGRNILETVQTSRAIRESLKKLYQAVQAQY